MTNVPVKDYNQTFSNVTSTNTQNSSNNAFNSSFTKVMSKTSASNSSSQQGNKANEKTEPSTNPKVEKKSQDVIKDNSETKKTAEKIDERNPDVGNMSEKAIHEETVNEGSANEEVINEEAVSEKATEVLTEISQQLDVSEEEVLAAMEALGLQTVDLLNPENLAELVVNISGETDMLSLATNEELYQTLQKLTETVGDLVGELQQELSLTAEQMGSIISKIKTQLEVQENMTNESSDTTKNQLKDSMVESSLFNEMLSTGSGDQTMEEKVVKTEIVIENLKNSNESLPKQVVDELSKETVDTEETLNAVGEDSKSSESNSKGNENSENGSSLFQGFVNQTTDSISTQESVQTALGKADVENILKQITDYMKIQVKADFTEMELQLHPASLGTINLQITSKGGVITAQFTAQNEAVKQALETQIIQLRENLEQQGIKIEAVEVTIASHEFERNLNKGNDSNADSDQEKKRSTRRINLNDLSLEEEQALDLGDLLTRDIMEKNGNTVDYTA